MPRRPQPARRRRSAITAPPAAWQRLGRLLEGRRRELGHTYRPGFEAASGVNRRLQADIETAAPKRINTFMPGTMHLIARGYQVTEESVLAVLRGDADELAPASPAAPLPGPPPEAVPREPSVRPHAAALWERLLQLAARGVTDPDGAQLGLSGRDAKVWDGSAGAMSQADRAWLVADMRLRREARAADSRAAGA
jgi:hypothetical protein